jgi:predicted MPP superfamily phosphohydrolase
VDACNNLRGDMVFVTGDLITTAKDPLDDCILELSKLKSGTGIWGCMGNHEMYAKVQRYTKERAAAFGMDFLRYEGRSARFGNSKISLIGVDFQKGDVELPGIDGLLDPEAFNVLLSHTPEIFPTAHKKGFQLTLSGHTHGGQINLELAGANLNLVDLATPYTKGLYWLNGSAIYVNSGLGTIGVPVRIGAPAEISVIRLCNS